MGYEAAQVRLVFPFPFEFLHEFLFLLFRISVLEKKDRNIENGIQRSTTLESLDSIRILFLDPLLFIFFDVKLPFAS